MYISKISLEPHCDPSLIFRSIPSTSYGTHKMIWKLFADSPDRKRDFLFRKDNQQGKPAFITVSKRLPLPDANIWRIQSKPYDPKLTKGQRLAFTLRANPVRSKRTEEGKVARHDVVMESKTKSKQEKCSDNGSPHIAEIVQEAGFQWLESRAERYGFSIQAGEVLADGYYQHTFHKKGRKVKISTMEFNGLLTVTDPVALTDVLSHGIGPAKSFGCGLMLLRRV